SWKPPACGRTASSWRACARRVIPRRSARTVGTATAPAARQRAFVNALRSALDYAIKKDTQPPGQKNPFVHDLCRCSDGRSDRETKFAVACRNSSGNLVTNALLIRLDTKTKKRLEALARRVKRPQSRLAAEAITAFVDSENWQLDQIQSSL